MKGSAEDDRVGYSIVALNNGNFVIGSPYWNNNGRISVGAITWCNGSFGVNGTVNSSNSLVGSTANDLAGRFISKLANGNYVVSVDVHLHVNASGANGQSFAVLITGGTPAVTTMEFLNNAWNRINVPFTAGPGPNITFTFAGEYNGSDVSYYIDNATITKASAPTPESSIIPAPE